MHRVLDTTWAPRADTTPHLHFFPGHNESRLNSHLGRCAARRLSLLRRQHDRRLSNLRSRPAQKTEQNTTNAQPRVKYLPYHAVPCHTMSIQAKPPHQPSLAIRWAPHTPIKHTDTAESEPDPDPESATPPTQRSGPCMHAPPSSILLRLFAAGAKSPIAT
jgi:hypothetical protein